MKLINQKFVNLGFYLNEMQSFCIFLLFFSLSQYLLSLFNNKNHFKNFLII